MGLQRLQLYYYSAVAAVVVCSIACSAESTYRNPLVAGVNHPDPGALVFRDGRYFVATTSGDEANSFPIISSTDFVHWTHEGFIFPAHRRPPWAVSDFWAPEFHHIGNTMVVYYAARDSTGMLCVGAAVSESGHILGPYKDIGRPLVRNDTVGNIDPTSFVDERDGTRYLIWKEDGNGSNPPELETPIWAQKLSQDGLSLDGTEKVEILNNNRSSWEGPLVEGPWIIKPKGGADYFLFYSANGYLSSKYAIGVARSPNLLGPYVKYEGNPIVHSNNAWDGPGHCSVVLDPNRGEHEYVMFMHSWVHGQIGGAYPRLLLMDAIVWTESGWPIINGLSPSSGPTPLPPV